MSTSILLITISGPDRPGIVRQVAACLSEHQGNWERSRLIHLAGRFVGLLQVSVPESRKESLQNQLLTISGLDLTIAEGSTTGKRESHSLSVSLVGADHPGIVKEIFGALADIHLNVESMSTRTEAAADSGTLLFHAKARVSSENSISSEVVQDKLEEIAGDLLVEVSVAETQ